MTHPDPIGYVAGNYAARPMAILKVWIGAIAEQAKAGKT